MIKLKKQVLEELEKETELREQLEERVEELGEQLKTIEEENKGLKEAERRLEMEYEEKLHKIKLEKEKYKAEIDNNMVQTIQMLKNKHEREIVEIEKKHYKEITEEKQRLQKENYEHLGTELKKLHSEGNAQTNFVQSLALKMVENKTKQIEDNEDRNREH